MKKALFLLLFCAFQTQAFAAWTATPISKTFADGKLTVSVRYENGISTWVRAHRVDSYGQFIVEVRSEINRLNVIDGDISKVTIGVPVDVSVTPPSQDLIDRQAFAALVSDWLAKKKAVDGGLSKTVTQMDVDAAYALVKSAFKIEYAGMIPVIQ